MSLGTSQVRFQTFEFSFSLYRLCRLWDITVLTSHFNSAVGTRRNRNSEDAENPKIWAQRALLSCKVICSFLSSLLPSALLFIPEWPLWIMRCSKGNRDNGSTLEAANRHWDKVIQHLTRKCCVFASSSEQRDGSLLINADSLKSTLCQCINNKLAFREGYIAMKGR